MRAKLVMMMVLCGMMGVVGCRPTVNSVAVRNDGYEWINTDWALGDIAAIKAVRQTREDDLLRVQVEMENLTSRRQGFKYQFVWMDAAGMVVNTPFIWRNEFVEGRQSIAITGIAPDARIQSCRLEMKRLIQ